jgi:hypothetical protein
MVYSDTAVAYIHTYIHLYYIPWIHKLVR